MGKFRDGMPVTGEAVTLILFDHRPDQGNPRRAGEEPARAGRRRRRSDRQAREHGAADAAPQAGRAERRRHAGPSGAGTPAASRRGFARRTGARLPRDAGSGAAPSQRRAARQAGAEPSRRARRRRARREQGRQPVDPRQCRHARTPDDHGVGAGADAQPAAGDRAPARRIPNSRCRCSGSPTSPPSCRKAS